MPGESLPRSLPVESKTFCCCSAWSVPTVLRVMYSFEVSESETFSCACAVFEIVNASASAIASEMTFAVFIRIPPFVFLKPFSVRDEKRTIYDQAVCFRAWRGGLLPQRVG